MVMSPVTAAKTQFTKPQQVLLEGPSPTTTPNAAAAMMPEVTPNMVEEQVVRLEEQRSQMMNQSLELLRGATGLQPAQLAAMRKRYSRLSRLSGIATPGVAPPSVAPQQEQEPLPLTVAAEPSKPVVSSTEKELDLLRGATGLQPAQIAAMRKRYDRLSGIAMSNTTPPSVAPQQEQEPLPLTVAADPSKPVVSSTEQALDLLRGATGLQPAQIAAMRKRYDMLSSSTGTNTSTLATTEVLDASELLSSVASDSEVLQKDQLDAMIIMRKHHHLMQMAQGPGPQQSLFATVASGSLKTKREQQPQKPLSMEELELLRGATGGLQKSQLDAIRRRLQARSSSRL